MQPVVLIVRPEPSRGLGAFYRNLGLTMLATHLHERGLSTRLIDLTFESIPDHFDPSPRIALFSLYIDDFSVGVDIARHLKEAYPPMITAVGGPHATLLGPSVFELGDAFDLVCVGDCLSEAIPIIDAIARGAELPSRRLISPSGNAARMDTLAPDYGIWSDSRYFPVFPVEMSRGCRQHCPFCTDPVLRRGLALDPVERTMTTIRSLVDRHGAVWIRFVDSSMTSLGEDLNRFLVTLTEAALPVQWSAYGYPHDITDELAGRLAAAGCVALFLGIESLGDGVSVGKHHAKRPDEVARAVEALHRNGIFVHGNFIVGLPGETRQTLAQARGALALLRFDSVGGGPFFLTPGSTFDLSPDRFGIQILDSNWPLRQHLNFYDSEYEYFRTATLTQPQMRQLSADFRRHVETHQLACWNLSDYAVLCWLSVGGDISDLTRLWKTDGALLTADQSLVLSVLKEKRGIPVTEEAVRFVQLSAAVAASAKTVAA